MVHANSDRVADKDHAYHRQELLGNAQALVHLEVNLLGSVKSFLCVNSMQPGLFKPPI